MSAYRSFMQSTLRRSGSNSSSTKAMTAVSPSSPLAGPVGTPPPVPARPANSYMVIQDFIATDDDELSLSKGTAVTVTHKYDNGWWLGEYAGMRGCFPYYCVKPRGQHQSQQTTERSARSTSQSFLLSPAQSLASSVSSPSQPPPKVTAAMSPHEYVIVKNDYHATDTRELTIRKGDIILIQKKTESGWWLGCVVDTQLRLTSSQGFFPSNYVTPYVNSSSVQPNSTQVNDTGSTSGPWMAIAAYEATNAQELALKPGQVLQVLAQYPNGWWIGRTSTGMGLFPGSFVKQVSPEEILLLERNQQQKKAEERRAQEVAARQAQAHAASSPSHQLSPQPTPCQRAVALYDYSPQNSTELALQAGNNVSVLQKHDSGWWMGESNGFRGLFPSNFVRELPTPPPVVRPSSPSAGTQSPMREAVAVSSYTAQQPGELSLRPGNVIEVLNQGQVWWLGRLDGAMGRFPAASVRLKPSQPQRPSSPSPSAMPSLTRPPSYATTQQTQRVSHQSNPTDNVGLSDVSPDYLGNVAPSAPPDTEEEAMIDMQSFSDDLRRLEETQTPAKDEQIISLLRDAVVAKSSAPAPPPKSKLKSLLGGHDTIGKSASKKKNLFLAVGPFEAGMLCGPVVSRAIVPNSMLATRGKVAKELYHTELSYVRCLALLNTAYEQPIRDSLSGKAILKKNDVDAIFSNAQQVLQANLKLLYKLELAINKHSSNMAMACVGPLFPDLKAEFSAYAEYAIGYSKAVDILMSQLKKNGRFKRFLADTAARNSQCTGQSLQSFLIMPVQRTPRYVLLLHELIKNTPPEHRDYMPLLSAKAAMEDVAMFINEEKRKAEQMGELDDLISLIEPHQSECKSVDLLKHGPVVMQLDNGPSRKRYLFLFRQVIIVTKKQSDFFGSGMNYAVVHSWPLAQCRWKGEAESTNSMLLGTPNGDCCVEAEDSGQLSTLLEWRSAFEGARLLLVGG